MDYSKIEDVAERIAMIDFSITSTGGGDFSPEHIKYNCTLFDNRSKESFDTSYQCNPNYTGEPTIADVFSALVTDAISVDGMSIDYFADNFGFTKPSEAIRCFNACTKTLGWLRDEVGFSSGELSQMAETLDENLNEVKEAVAKLQEEKAEKDAYEHPKTPTRTEKDGTHTGFYTIDELEETLDLGDYGDQCPDYAETYVSDCFTDVADSNVDIYTSSLRSWLVENDYWLEIAELNGLLDGCMGDLNKMAQMAQYEAFSSDLYEHREDICKYVTLESLRDSGIYAIAADLAEEILGGIDYDDGDRFSDYLDEAESTIENWIENAVTDLVGEDVAETMDMPDINQPNPMAMSKVAVLTVNNKGGLDACMAELASAAKAEAADLDETVPVVREGSAQLETESAAKDVPETEHEGTTAPSGNGDAI